uniref:Uncharacterized protein MANES_05G134700 n=1 Tax=Rhizophora mucronata TaxID=61149 RepID=A0A2P2L5G4_RHIMU
MEVEMLSQLCIKPSTPTPDHLKTYKISLIDQIIPSYYVPMILVYPMNQETEHLPSGSFKSERSLRLKQSLSEALTIFYPLAGKVKDDLTIDCDDEGACYVEARSVGGSLSQHLSQPDPKFNRKLLPPELNCWRPSPGSHVVLVQETTFACGGIAIGVLITHMVGDGMAFGSFLNYWAAQAHTPGELDIAQLRPIFESPSLFPQNDAYPKEATLRSGRDHRVPISQLLYPMQ